MWRQFANRVDVMLGMLFYSPTNNVNGLVDSRPSIFHARRWRILTMCPPIPLFWAVGFGGPVVASLKYFCLYLPVAHSGSKYTRGNGWTRAVFSWMRLCHVFCLRFAAPVCGYLYTQRWYMPQVLTFGNDRSMEITLYVVYCLWICSRSHCRSM